MTKRHVTKIHNTEQTGSIAVNAPDNNITQNKNACACVMVFIFFNVVWKRRDEEMEMYRNAIIK